MLNRKIIALLLLICFGGSAYSQDILRVSKDPDMGGQYRTIQEAVDLARPYSTIIIMDNEIYEEQVTIEGEGKNGITLTSQNPQSPNKPTIKWRDTQNVGPRSWAESQIPDSINFDYNGALRCIRVRNVTIDGIKISGGSPFPFGYESVWGPEHEKQHPNTHGNAAIVLTVAGNITVRNSEIADAFFGFYIKDRNTGGIYGNSNPADIDPDEVIPLSGFGRVGNHLIENNRIYDNSYGLFFESSWDLGSTIRFNLIFDNFHTRNTLSAFRSVPESDNLPGGAFLFQDNLFTPMAIYNNTLYNNFRVFSTTWQAAAHHLIFNNIVAKPKFYWSSGYVPSTINFDEWKGTIDHLFEHRMKHTLYAAQKQAPTERREWVSGICGNGEHVNGIADMQITNDFPRPQRGSTQVTVTCSDGSTDQTTTNRFIPPGALLSGDTFPADANVRWLEAQDYFISTDPANPNFLVPNWSNPVVSTHIRGAGWPEAGIRKADGSMADLGAIQHGGQSNTLARIRPLAPVMISGSTAVANIDLTVYQGELINPQIKYARYIRDLEYQEGSWMNDINAIPQNNIIQISSSNPINIGGTEIEFTIPPSPPGDYAFIELIIEGQDANGNTVTTDVGFLPYRELNQLLKVEITDMQGNPISGGLAVGRPVQLKMKGMVIDDFGNEFDFSHTINSQLSGQDISVQLGSGATLYDASNPPNYQPLEISSIPESSGSQDTIRFTTIPPGAEYVIGTAVWTNPNDPSDVRAFYGISAPITLLPGDPVRVEFNDPPSIRITAVPTTIDVGFEHEVSLSVLDEFGNRVAEGTPVIIESLQENVGNIIHPQTETSDSLGRVRFKAQVTGGQTGDDFRVRAHIPGVEHSQDTAAFRVGRERERLVIFYGDTLDYQNYPTGEIRRVVDQRVPVVIEAHPGNRFQIIDTSNTEITFTLSHESLVLYAEETSDQPITSAELVNGRVRVWITAEGPVTGGTIEVKPTVDLRILGSLRRNIFFTAPQRRIEHGAVFADNGDGSLNRMVIHYREVLSAKPDSIGLRWPQETGGHYRVAKGDQITWDPANPTPVTVTFSEPFPEGITGLSGSPELGTHYYSIGGAPERFNIVDSIGPLITSARLTERLEPGTDTIIVTFSEGVSLGSLEGQTLLLRKSGAASETPLTVTGAQLVDENWVRLIIEDAGANAPAEGDSIRFNPAATIVDNKDAAAHPNNRAVALSLLSIPPTITSAFYYDRTADGMVDQAVLHLNKNERIDGLTVSFMWQPAAPIHETAELSGERLSYGEDSSVIVVDIRDAFVPGIANQTSVNMEVTMAGIAFEGTVRAIVRDGAAPIITDAEYEFGIGENRVDTMTITFSEMVELDSMLQPSIVFSREGTDFYNPLEVLDQNGPIVRYLIHTANPAYQIPAANDAVFINPGAKVMDITAQKNQQINPNNKRVPLQIVDAPTTFSTVLGPNPYRYSENQQFKLDIVADNTLTFGNMNFNVELSVYDNMGNIIYTLAEDDLHKLQDRFAVTWNVRNRNSRSLSTGTYLIIVSVTNSEDGEVMLSERRKLSIVK